MFEEMKMEFQFHKGTIRTLRGYLVLMRLQVHFNSIKVRLELESYQTQQKQY